MLGTADRFLLTSFLIMEASMRVLLYPHHHNLPFWHEPGNCMGVFIPSDFAGKQFEVESGKYLPVSEMDIWPVLLGLRQLELPFWAHVSAFRAHEENKIYPAYRRWIQITTRPLREPILVSKVVKVMENDCNLISVWGHDNGTHSPVELLPKGDWEDPKIKAPEFWSDYFTKELKATKANAEQRVVRAKAFADLFSSL